MLIQHIIAWFKHWYNISIKLLEKTNYGFCLCVQLAGTAKSRFSAKDYSDHMALVRAYEGWKDAEREGSAYEYCWRNFLSAQTLQAIHSLRKQFSFILKEADLVDADASLNNKLSPNQALVRAVICSGLFPGIASVVVSYLSLVNFISVTPMLSLQVKLSLFKLFIFLIPPITAQGDVHVI